MTTFRVTVTTLIDVEVADGLLARAEDADWVRDFYGLDTPELIAEHLAWNIGLNHRDLSHLDGFADRDDREVRCDVVAVDYETERVTL